MTSDEYAQILDDFELNAPGDVMPGESLTEYINRRRREFESKADGGSIGIEVLFREKNKNGGRIGLKDGLMPEDYLYSMDKDAKGFLIGEDSDKIPEGLPEDYLFKIDDEGKIFIVPTKESEDKRKDVEVEDVEDIIERDTPRVGILSGFSPLAFLRKYLAKKELEAKEENKADGGRVGLFMGGPALEGQALNIYNSMNAYGFSDQEIANALEGQGLYTPPGSGAEPPTTIQPVGFQGGGGDGRVTELQETFTKDLSQDPRFDYLEPTAQANKYRFDRSVEPRDGLMGLVDKTKNFFAENKFFQPKVRGTLGTRLSNQPRLPLPGSIAAYARSPFNPDSPTYNANIADQLNFLELGENLIGRDPGTGGLKYGSGSVLSGKNVISGFGTNNYDTALRNFISKMKANTRISAERKAARLAAAEKELLDLQTKSKKGLGRDVDRGGFDPSGPTQRSIRAEREDKSGKGQSGGFTNPGAGSYGPHMADGGLATMFTRRR
jgi:hypothetical protein